jgi:hypothetical protein
MNKYVAGSTLLLLYRSLLKYNCLVPSIRSVFWSNWLEHAILTWYQSSQVQILANTVSKLIFAASLKRFNDPRTRLVSLDVRLEKAPHGPRREGGVEIQLPSLFHQIGLLVELARACNSNNPCPRRLYSNI